MPAVRTITRIALFLILSVCGALPVLRAGAQIPNTLLQSIPLPPLGVQIGGQLGYSVALEGDYAVAGIPHDNSAGFDRGLVKVFHAATGALLHVLPNGGDDAHGMFGSSVAISGSRIVAGAPLNAVGVNNIFGGAYVYDLNSPTPAKPVLEMLNPEGESDDNFGFTVAVSGTRVVVGASRANTPANDSGRVYVYDLSSLTPAVPVEVIDNPEPESNDQFGYAVAISGTRLVTGAINNRNPGGIAGGSVYVYDLAGLVPAVPVTVIHNPEPAVLDFFGNALAVAGNRLAVAASGDDTGAVDAGSVYIYDLAGATPMVPATVLPNPSPEAGDGFGSSLAVSAARVVVGAGGDDTGAPDAGTAWVYDLAGPAPAVPVATLSNPGPGAGDAFGVTVAIDGTRIMAGAPSDNTGATDTGSAWVFDLSSATPSVPLVTLYSPTPAGHRSLGYRVALSGRFLAASAGFDEMGMSSSGSVLVYDLANGISAVPFAILNKPEPHEADGFGEAIAISGSMIAVGAPYGYGHSGVVYVFDMNSGTPAVPVSTIINPDLDSDEFGSAVAISGTRVVIGAPDARVAGLSAGSVWVFELSGAPPPVGRIPNPAPGHNEAFGYSVGIDGPRIVVGAYWDRAGGIMPGRAFIYDLTAGSPQWPVLTLENPSQGADDLFGAAVAISGSRVLIGAYANDSGADAAGSVWLFDLSSADPALPVLTLTNPRPLTQGYFGHALALSGTRAVVGAFQGSEGVDKAGRAWIYDLAGPAPATPLAGLQSPHPAPYDGFGVSVAVDGSRAVIGAPGDNTDGPFHGFAGIFGPHPADQDSDGLLDSWERSHWPDLSGHAAPDDSDGDGYTELLEMAFGLNPSVSDPGGLPAVVSEDGFLTVTITKQPGVLYEVQTSGTLLPGLPESFSAADTTILTSTAATLKVRDNFPAGTQNRRYLRIKVTAAP